MNDYYKILGVSKNATEKEIQQAYRHLASTYHPDKNKSSEADRKYKEINEAYSILHNIEKRKRYDNQQISSPFSNQTRYQQTYQTYRPTYSNPFFYYEQAHTYRKYSADEYSFLAQWNWGAFLLGPIWAVLNNVMAPLLLYLFVLIPGYGWFFLFFIQFLYGYKGNAWAWQKRKTDAIDKFKRVQNNWKIFAICFYSLFIFLSIFYFVVHLIIR